MNFGVLTSARLAVLATAKSSAIETSHSDAIDNTCALAPIDIEADRRRVILRLSISLA
jgi:hypothetical protein